MPIRDILDRLEDAERSFVGRRFLAPVLPGRGVMVRIAGIRCRLQSLTGLPEPRYTGLALLKALSSNEAAFERPAGLRERAAYLALFPAVRVILIRSAGGHWLAVPAHRGDRRLRVEGPVRLLLAEEGLLPFDTVIARFDGRLFWYDSRDPRRNPAIAAYLREALDPPNSGGLPLSPDELRKRGLSPEERDAYAIRWLQAAETAVSRTERRLREALEHARARLRSYFEREDAYLVSFEVDGQEYSSTVRRDDLTVLSAGVCLSGRDEDFDLTSLVGVLREGSSRGRWAWD
jgi:hypothetical protein